MTLYVELQKQVIGWLRTLRKETLVALLRLAEVAEVSSSGLWVPLMRGFGLQIALEEPWYRDIDFRSLIKEQLYEKDDGVIVVRGVLGFPMYSACDPTFELEEWVARRGNGHCRLRTATCAQPGALKDGDILATGERVLGQPREGGNGAVLVHLSGTRDLWLSFPARTALALHHGPVPRGLIEN